MDLKDFFKARPQIAIAFSGGTDSSYLLAQAVRYAERVRAYHVITPFQPAFETRDAEELARSLGADMVTLEMDILDDPIVASNPPDRCYHCKKKIMSLISERAHADGFESIADGTNASDDLADRPGCRALKEMHIVSPLLECGITKPMLREASRADGLMTWDKPSYACLATRIPHGTTITHDMLSRVEHAEDALREMGFRDLRVRVVSDSAKIQLTDADLQRAFDRRSEILSRMGRYFDSILLDLAPRRQGE